MGVSSSNDTSFDTINLLTYRKDKSTSREKQNVNYVLYCIFLVPSNSKIFVKYQLHMLVKQVRPFRINLFPNSLYDADRLFGNLLFSKADLGKKALSNMNCLAPLKTIV